MNEIIETKLKQYFDITRKALEKVKIPHAKDSEKYKNAHTFLDMATRYFKDAEHFQKKGDFVNAFACLNYAHGWLDAGAMIKLFDVEGDSYLFTVD